MTVDVLDVLRKLPPVCAAWLEGENRGVIIHRGWHGYTDFPLATREAVIAFNQRKGVTPEQVECMMNGVTLGWDAEGARPTGEGFAFIYEANFVLLMSVNAATEDEAATEAQAVVKRVAEWISTQDLGESVLTLAPDTDEINLVEKQ